MTPEMIRKKFLAGGLKAGAAWLALPAALQAAQATSAANATSAEPADAAPGAKKPARAGKPPRAAKNPNAIVLTTEPTFDESLNVVAAYLTQYRPPEGQFPAQGPSRAHYDLIAWEGAKTGEDAATGKAYYCANTVIGGVDILREPRADGVAARYEIESSIALAPQGADVIKAEIECGPGALLGIREWRCEFFRRPAAGAADPAPALRLVETGRRVADGVEIRSGDHVRRLATLNPLASQWTMLDALRLAPKIEDDTVVFDLLRDLADYCPGQRLLYVEPIQLTLGGRERRLTGTVHIGAGALPTHVWLDEDRRPLLMTAGMLSLALTAVGPA